MKPTQERIDLAIKNLKELRPKIVPRTYFGDDNLAALDAMVEVLEKNLRRSSIGNRWDIDEDEHTYSAAMDARDWMDGLLPDEPVDENWPLRENLKS